MLGLSIWILSERMVVGSTSGNWSSRRSMYPLSLFDSSRSCRCMWRPKDHSRIYRESNLLRGCIRLSGAS